MRIFFFLNVTISTQPRSDEKWKIIRYSLATYYSFTLLVGVKLWCPSFYQMKGEGKEVLIFSQAHVFWKQNAG